MKRFLQVTSRTDGRRIPLSIDKIEKVVEQSDRGRDRDMSSILYDGERVLVEESYDYIVEQIGKSMKDEGRMKRFIQVTDWNYGNRLLLSLDKIERVVAGTDWEKDKDMSIIFYNGERIAVEEPYEYVMEKMRRFKGGIQEENNGL